MIEKLEPQEIIVRARATINWCVRLARDKLEKGELENALIYCKLAADAMVQIGDGRLVSPELESILIQINSELGLGQVELPLGSGQRWLHVFTRAKDIGGHTILATRWIEWDSTSNEHSIVLLEQFAAVPASLRTSVESKRGQIFILDPTRPMIERVVELYKIASTFDVVVMHTNPNDVVAPTAFACASGPRVLVLNHADHIPWVGARMADLVVNIRPTGTRWSEKYRGISRNVELPIPIASRLSQQSEMVLSERRKLARQSLGIPEESPVLLTIGQAFKYAPTPALDFLDAAKNILHARPDTHLIAVGPNPDGRWAAISREMGGQVHAFGNQTNLEPYHLAADVYLESFPFGSLTATLEVGTTGLPCVLAPAPCVGPFCADGPAFDMLSKPTNVDDFVSQTIELIDSVPLRQEIGERFSLALTNYHCGEGWQSSLSYLQQSIPSKHSLYKCGDMCELDSDTLNYWSNFALRVYGKDVLKHTARAALDYQLEPTIDEQIVLDLQGQLFNKTASEQYDRVRLRHACRALQHELVIKSQIEMHLMEMAQAARQNKKRVVWKRLPLILIKNPTMLTHPESYRILLLSFPNRKLRQMLYILRSRYRTRASEQPEPRKTPN